MWKIQEIVSTLCPFLAFLEKISPQLGIDGKVHQLISMADVFVGKLSSPLLCLLRT